MAKNNFRVPLGELGRTGLDYSRAGFIFEEFLPQLQGIRAVRTYKEMSMNDPVVGAILFVVDMLIRQVEWRVEGASDDKTDVEAKEFLESVIDDMDMSFTDVISEVMSMLIYGYSYHEIVYKRRLGDNRNPDIRSRFNDGRIGWRKLPIRSQDTISEWVFDDAGETVAAIQQAPPDYIDRVIPMEKALLFRTLSHKGNPEGRSVLRNAYRPWFFKKRIEEIEGIGIERDLAGLPMAWVPPNLLSPTATAEEVSILNAIKQLVVNVRRDEQEGVVFPLAYDDKGNKLYDFTLLSTGGRRQFDTDAIVNRYDQRIAMTILADFVLLGHNRVGSFALSSSKTNLFATAIGAWLMSIAEVFNRFAIPRLFKLNNLQVDDLPKLVPGDIENIPLDELGDYISKLAGAGMPLFPNKDLEETLLQYANLPITQGE